MGGKPLYISTGRGATDALTEAGLSVTVTGVLLEKRRPNHKGIFII
jgi:hypothetical protein